MARDRRLTGARALVVLALGQGCIADITGAPCVAGQDTCPSGQYCGSDMRCVLGLGGSIGDAGTIDAGTSLEVLQTVTRHTETGATSTPTVFTSDSMELYVRNGAGFAKVTSGTPGAAGHFSFTGIPSGQRYLRRGDEWMVNPPATVDLSYRAFGRTAVQVADGGVGLGVAATSMNAWTTGSELQLVSPNAGLVGFHFESGLVTPLLVGAVPSALAFDYVEAYSWSADPPAPLVDTTKGDIVYLTQLEGSSMSTSDGPVPVRALAKSAVLAPLTLAIGPPKTLTATFSEPPTVTANITWRRADYWQLGSSVTPRFLTDTAYDQLNISVPPYFGGEGLYDATPDLLTMGDELAKGATSNLSVTATFRNPYPSSWTPMLFIQYCHFGPAQTAGGTATIAPFACSGRTDALASATAQPLTIGITPPTNLQIGGAMAYGGMALSTLSPTVSWTAPATGTPTSYALEVRHIIPDGTDLTTEWAATVVTHGTSVMIPPGVLRSGQFYYVRVIAHLGLDVLATPFKTALSWQYAAGVSGVVSAQ